MNKQKKQMIFLGIILLMIMVCVVIICLLPKEKTEEVPVTFQVTSYDVEDIQRFTFTNANGTYTFARDEDEWIYEADRMLDVDETKIENMIEKVAAYEAENKITDVTDLSAYGLQNPEKKILISDGMNSTTFLVGAYNNITYTYYMCLESNPDTVYTMTSADLSVFDQSIDELVVKTEENTTVETTESVQ